MCGLVFLLRVAFLLANVGGLALENFDENVSLC